MSKFGFIGAGNMGGALAVALSKSIEPNNILLADKMQEKAENLATQIGAKVSTNEEIAKEAKFIFLAVKPQFMANMLEEIAPILKNRNDEFVLVSIAAGLTKEKIRIMADGNYPVIRVMPNTPAFLGEGMLLFTTCDVNEKTQAEFLNCMKKAGIWDEIDESLIDAASALSGCGPAFVYMFIEALADGAVKCGLPRDKALKYAAQTVKGSAMMVESTGKHPELLKDEVCSPGGTTIAGVSALENGGFRANCINAVTDAYNKTLELGK
ncbi:MAG: pyrroline-5-carboxylate reductase [Clostridia bacterium]|nr:pyrroline-5-carboxylate reductase [Clostridia bacterium]